MEQILKTNFMAADDYSKDDSQEIIKFKVSTDYGTRSICDHNCIFKFTVQKRTDKNIWILEKSSKKVIRRKIDIWNGEESIFPYGKYSMAPILRAGDEHLLENLS
jgi:hypothetical protein